MNIENETITDSQKLQFIQEGFAHFTIQYNQDQTLVSGRVLQAEQLARDAHDELRQQEAIISELTDRLRLMGIVYGLTLLSLIGALAYVAGK